MSSLRPRLIPPLEQTFAEVTRCINGLKVARLLSDESTEEGEKAAAEGYLKRYYETLPLGALPFSVFSLHLSHISFSRRQGSPANRASARRRLCSPRLPGLRQCLLAVPFVPAFFSLLSQLLTLSRCADDRSYLERCIMITSTALLTSKYKYQLRILTSNILRLLAAPSLSLTHYRTFGVKNVQHDTLSHLVVGRGSTFAIENAGKEGGVFEATTETEKWYNGGKLEAQEMVLKAFTYGSFSKVRSSLPIPSQRQPLTEPFCAGRGLFRVPSPHRQLAAEPPRHRRSPSYASRTRGRRTRHGRDGDSGVEGGARFRSEGCVSRSFLLQPSLTILCIVMQTFPTTGTTELCRTTNARGRSRFGSRQSSELGKMYAHSSYLSRTLCSPSLVQAAWLRAFATLYSRFLSPGIEIVSEEAPTSVRKFTFLLPRLC